VEEVQILLAQTDSTLFTGYGIWNMHVK